jgi:hypothetical protein
MPYPEFLGKPCWTLDQVPKVISLTAQTSSSSAASFLAAHSPFRRITDAKSTGVTMTEEEVFTSIFSRANRSVQAFVKGEPGTGKSHLIRWLKERSDYRWNKENTSAVKPRIVLVTRGNGSLKDALGQIVRQLGNEFDRHLRLVQGAIDRLSAQTARATLLAELALEIDSRWVNEHGRQPLDRSLRHLGQALRSEGFGGLMKREGGVIDQIIKRLTDPSSVDDREHYPAFTNEDLHVSPGAFSRQTVSAEVYNFVEDLSEEDDTRKKAVEVLNIALRDAIRATTGIKGNDLLSIFTEIRRQLGSKESLAVFIEDVSVTGLDQDVVNAFEPRDEEKGLCPMIAVLGITENGWQRLPDSQRQRATQVYEVGGEGAQSWASSRDEVAKFTARYLNAVRSTDAELEAIAESRFKGDVSHSRCHDCPCKSECHSVFGKVTFEGGVEVGMFPFSENAPHALLSKLTDARYRSQRGLLDHVILKALEQSFDSLEAHRFPRLQVFQVEIPTPPIWAGFVNRFSSGAAWDDERRQRLRFLASFWVESNNADEMATALQPFLAPLGLPSFSGSPVSHPLSSVNASPKSQNSVTAGTAKLKVDTELDRLLGLLDKWEHSSQPLKEDSKFRDLLGKFLRDCIVWEDFLGIPITERKRLIGGNTVPKIEGQVANPTGRINFGFPRNTETRALIQSLLLLERSPSKTWNFSDAEIHKRAVSRWLRRHRRSVVNSIQPTEPYLVEQCLRSAVQALALTAMLRDRKRFSDNRAERIQSLLEAVWSGTERPVTVSPELGVVVGDLEQKHATLRSFVIQEVGAGQGSADPKDFINPVPLLELLNDFERRFCFEPPPNSAQEGHWSTRFTAIHPFCMGAFESIPEKLKKERRAIGADLEKVQEFMKDAGFVVDNPRENIDACLTAVVEVIELQHGAHRKPGILPIPNPEFENLWQGKHIQTSDVRASWGVALENAQTVYNATSVSDVAVFNPSKFKQCVESLRVIEGHLNSVEKQLQESETMGGPQGDTRTQLLAVLDKMASSLEAGEQVESDSE